MERDAWDLHQLICELQQSSSQQPYNNNNDTDINDGINDMENLSFFVIPKIHNRPNNISNSNNDNDNGYNDTTSGVAAYHETVNGGSGSGNRNGIATMATMNSHPPQQHQQHHHHERRMLRRLDRLLEQIHGYFMSCTDNNNNNNNNNNKNNNNIEKNGGSYSSTTSNVVMMTTDDVAVTNQYDSYTPEGYHHHDHRHDIQETQEKSFYSNHHDHSTTNQSNHNHKATTTGTSTLLIPTSLRLDLIYILTRLSIPKQQPQQQQQASSMRHSINDNTTSMSLRYSIIGPLTISILQKSMNLLSLLPSLSIPQQQSGSIIISDNHPTSTATYNCSTMILSHEDVDMLYQQLILHNHHHPDHNNTKWISDHSNTATSIWLSLLMSFYMQHFCDDDNNDDATTTNQRIVFETPPLPLLDVLVPSYMPAILQIAQRMLLLLEPSSTSWFSTRNSSNSNGTTFSKQNDQNQMIQQWQIVVGYMIQSWMIQTSSLLWNDNDHDDQMTSIQQHLSNYITELIQYTIDILDIYALANTDITATSARSIYDHTNGIDTTTTTPSIEEYILFPYLTICINVLKPIGLWLRSSPLANTVSLSHLNSAYRNQLVLLWTALGTLHVPSTSNQYKISFYQLQVTDLVLSSLLKASTTTTEPRTCPSPTKNTTNNRNHTDHVAVQNQNDKGIPLYHDIPNEKILILIFLRAMQYPDVLLLESNLSIWYYLQQRILSTKQQPHEVERLHLKRMIQASTLTFQKQHIIQIQKDDQEQQQQLLHHNQQMYSQQAYDDDDDDDDNDDDGALYTNTKSSTNKFHHRSLFNRLLSILPNTNDKNNENKNCNNNDVVMMNNDPWDLFFCKTIEQYS